MNKNYRVVKDVLDLRDRLFSVPEVPALPAMVDLRPGMPPVYDQGELGSCTGNAIAAAFQYDQMKEKISSWAPSRLFIYYNERLIEGTISEDDGAQIRDGIKAIASYGVCEESVWAYDVAKFAVQPPAEAYADAKTHEALQYARVDQDLETLKKTLAGNFPIVVGITLYDGFESDEVAASGMVQMPNPEMEQCLGGHCVLVVGYDDSKKCFIMRNSWGDEWGDKGYFYLPYNYLCNSDLGNDFWVVTQVK